jgi:YfiH family protein
VASATTRPNREPVEPRPPFQWLGEHLAVDLPDARAVFTTRRGGFSDGAFATLNLGRLTADDPEAVSRNRAVLQSHAGGRLAMIRQVHGTRVVRLGVADQASGPEPQGELEQADGQATGLVGIAPMVMTADCLPIALAGRGAAGRGAVAILHAGWRGLADGIIDEGVHAVREMGGSGTLAAAIGPGAGACCYEAGEGVHERFRAYGPRARRGRNLDLKAIARGQLLAAGVSAVHDAGLCTICSPPSLFFSHRRDNGVTGRQAGLIWLT